MPIPMLYVQCRYQNLITRKKNFIKNWMCELIFRINDPEVKRDSDITIILYQKYPFFSLRKAYTISVKGCTRFDLICLTNWPISTNLTNKQHEMETKLHNTVTIKSFTEVLLNLVYTWPLSVCSGMPSLSQKRCAQTIFYRTVQQIKHLRNNRLEM